MHSVNYCKTDLRLRTKFYIPVQVVVSLVQISAFVLIHFCEPPSGGPLFHLLQSICGIHNFSHQSFIELF